MPSKHKIKKIPKKCSFLPNQSHTQIYPYCIYIYYQTINLISPIIPIHPSIHQNQNQNQPQIPPIITTITPLPSTSSTLYLPLTSLVFPPQPQKRKKEKERETERRKEEEIRPAWFVSFRFFRFKGHKVLRYLICFDLTYKSNVTSCRRLGRSFFLSCLLLKKNVFFLFY